MGSAEVIRNKESLLLEIYPRIVVTVLLGFYTYTQRQQLQASRSLWQWCLDGHDEGAPQALVQIIGAVNISGKPKQHGSHIKTLVQAILQYLHKILCPSLKWPFLHPDLCRLAVKWPYCP